MRIGTAVRCASILLLQGTLLAATVVSNVFAQPDSARIIRAIRGIPVEPRGEPHVRVTGVTVEYPASTSPAFRVTLRNDGPGWAHRTWIGVRNAANAWPLVGHTVFLLRTGQDTVLTLATNAQLVPGRTYRYEVGTHGGIVDQHFLPLETGAFTVPVPARALVFDAAVGIIGLRVDSDNRLRAQLVVSNAGPEPAPRGRVRLLVDGAQVTGAEFPALPPASTWEIVLVSANAVSPGIHDVLARIQPNLTEAGRDARDANPGNDDATQQIEVSGRSVARGGNGPAPRPFWIWLLPLVLMLPLFHPAVWRRVRQALRIPPRVTIMAVPAYGTGRIDPQAAHPKAWAIEIVAISGEGRGWMMEGASGEREGLA